MNELVDLINLTSTDNTSCDEKKPNGSLKANFTGDSVNYEFYWFVGNGVKPEPDHIGYLYEHIAAGEYTLQVLDESLEAFVDPVTVALAHNPTYQPDETASWPASVAQ